MSKIKFFPKNNIHVRLKDLKKKKNGDISISRVR